MKTFEEWQEVIGDLRSGDVYTKIPRVNEANEQDNVLAAQIEAITGKEMFMKIEPFISDMTLVYEDLGFALGYYIAVLLQETGGAQNGNT